MPIPPGIEDCFGRYNDPDVLECQKCVEFKNCRAVQKARNDEEDSEKKGGKKKKMKHHKHDKEEKKSHKEKEEKEEKPKKTKGPSEAVQAILDEAKAEKYGKVKAGASKLYILVGKKKVVKISKANTEDKFVVQLRVRGGPEAVGLKEKGWKGKGSKFTYKGEASKLGGLLKTAIKAIKSGAEKE